jgi:hypothetical protein
MAGCTRFFTLIHSVDRPERHGRSRVVAHAQPTNRKLIDFEPPHTRIADHNPSDRKPTNRQSTERNRSHRNGYRRPGQHRRSWRSSD